MPIQSKTGQNSCLKPVGKDPLYTNDAKSEEQLCRALIMKQHALFTVQQLLQIAIAAILRINKQQKQKEETYTEASPVANTLQQSAPPPSTTTQQQYAGG